MLIGAGKHVPEEHEGNGGRNDLPERARGGDGPRGQLGIVAVAQHGRQGHEPHGDNGRSYDARAGGHEHAHEGDGQAKAAGEAAEDQGEAVQQLLGHLRFLEHYPHENKQRHSNHGLVGDRSEDAPGKKAKIAGIEGTPNHPAEAKEQGDAGQGKGHGIA